MSFIRRSWNDLSPGERSSWVDMDLTRPAVSNFIAANQIIARAGQPLLAEYAIPPLDPIGEISILQLTPEAFTLTADFIPSPLPEGQYLNVYCTRQLSPGTSQVSLQSYTWIQTFPPGTEPDPSVSVLDAYIARYGTPIVGRNISTKLILVNVGTGNFVYADGPKLQPVEPAI